MFSLRSNARFARRPSLSLGRLARRSLALGGERLRTRFARAERPAGAGEGGVFAWWPDARRHPSLTLG